MRETEAEFPEHSTRGRIRGMMPGKKALHPKCFKSVGNNRLPGLFGQTLSPIGRPQMKSNLVDLFARLIRPEPGAAHIVVVGEEK